MTDPHRERPAGPQHGRARRLGAPHLHRRGRPGLLREGRPAPLPQGRPRRLRQRGPEDRRASAAAELRDRNPDAAVVHLGQADSAGHSHGAAGRQYPDAIGRVDALVGQVLTAVENRPAYASPPPTATPTPAAPAAPPSSSPRPASPPPRWTAYRSTHSAATPSTPCARPSGPAATRTGPGRCHRRPGPPPPPLQRQQRPVLRRGRRHRPLIRPPRSGLWTPNPSAARPR
ncbi:alkaline phosphatase family protein [Streptomyces sp. NPDC031705]|uniref:alkaline phosphatase family protein n=1 Tax=Streptomyces sp. NPDC031705 TaxID=3155729 RepID=UPI0033ED35F3